MRPSIPALRAFHLPLMAILLLTMVGSVMAYPVPAGVPMRWELDFTPGDLRVYIDPVDNKPYWYFTYTVVNRTKRDQIWAPSFVLLTDVGEIRSSREGVRSHVEERIRDMLGNDLLEAQNEAIGDLLQGKEHAKDGLVVWPALRTDVNEVSLFIAGVSGETARVKNPITGNEVVLRKTLQRDYLIPGNVLPRSARHPVKLVRERWIMR